MKFSTSLVRTCAYASPRPLGLERFSLRFSSTLPSLLTGHSPSTLVPEHILPLDEYESIRPDVMQFRRAERANRRVQIGEHASLTFESFKLWWIQTHEMLRAEGGGDEQIADELSAYAPLVPRDGMFTATLMFEIACREQRLKLLSALGYVEDALHLCIDSQIKVPAVVSGDDDVARTTPDGKTSAVHFLKFNFEDDGTIAAFKNAENVSLNCTHPRYTYESPLPPSLLNILKNEL